MLGNANAPTGGGGGAGLLGGETSANPTEKLLQIQLLTARHMLPAHRAALFSSMIWGARHA